MLKIETVDDLEKLIAGAVEESLTLDYKASDALGTDDRKRNELCKDVTSFANAAGGQIVYGIVEDKHIPTGVDDGADKSITKRATCRLNCRDCFRENICISPRFADAHRAGFLVSMPPGRLRPFAWSDLCLQVRPLLCDQSAHLVADGVDRLKALDLPADLRQLELR
jgi:hypothetical protein